MLNENIFYGKTVIKKTLYFKGVIISDIKTFNSIVANHEREKSMLVFIICQDHGEPSDSPDAIEIAMKLMDFE